MGENHYRASLALLKNNNNYTCKNWKQFEKLSFTELQQVTCRTHNCSKAEQTESSAAQ